LDDTHILKGGTLEESNVQQVILLDADPLWCWGIISHCQHLLMLRPIFSNLQKQERFWCCTIVGGHP